MGTTDILTLIGLLFAIFAFIYESEGESVFLKFSLWNLVGIIVGFILINYLIFFDFYLSNDLYLDFFYITRGLKPTTWAYIISLLLIGFIFLKIFVLGFPYVNKEKLVLYYESLINKGEFGRVINYIEKYHQKEIHSFHRTLERNESFNHKEYENADAKKKAELLYQINHGGIKSKYHYSRQALLGSRIYHEIVIREDFIRETANKSPYFYSEIIKYFTYKNSSNQEFVMIYLLSLIKENNTFLRRELDTNNNIEDKTRCNYRMEEKNYILKSLLLDIKVAENTHAWHPFGEYGIEEVATKDYNQFDEKK